MPTGNPDTGGGDDKSGGSPNTGLCPVLAILKFRLPILTNDSNDHFI